MRFVQVLALLGCLVVCGSCGSASAQKAADEDSAVPGPPIEAIDEPSSESFWWNPRDEASGSTGYAHTYICMDDDPSDVDDEPCQPSPAEVEQMRRRQEVIDKATKPGEGVEPRAIARLRLTGRGAKSHALVIAWRNRTDKLCLGASEEAEDGGGGAGPFGPCVPESRCGDICLTFSGTGSGQESLYVTSGVLASEADQLRITFDDGKVVTYQLSGPLVQGFPEYRVFILDLGRGLDARLELLENGRVIAEEKRSRAELKAMRCYERFAPSWRSTGKQGDPDAEVRACLKEARSD